MITTIRSTTRRVKHYFSERHDRKAEIKEYNRCIDEQRHFLDRKDKIINQKDNEIARLREMLSPRAEEWQP